MKCTTKLRFRLPSRMTLAFLVLLVGIQAAQAEPLSVKEFNEKLDVWKTADKDPSTITLEVEGRVKIYSHDRLTLENCKVRFVSKKELPERTRKSMNVVVIGKVSRDSKTHEHTFQVSSIRVVPGELEQFLDRSRHIKQGVPEEWYALGRWAAVRGEFYADDELLSRADKAYRRGVEAERKAHSKDDPEGLLALADKAMQYRLLTLGQELTHEAFHLSFERSRNDPAAQLQKLADRLADALPGALEEVKSFPRDDLIDDYKRRPIETYEAADSATRRKLHRWLYAELQMRLILPGLKADGSNGFEIADQIVRIVPERRALAEGLRDRALKARAAEVEKLTRSQVIELSEQYRLRNQQRTANDLLESWLTLRKQALEPDDTEGLINLSEDYRLMLRRNDLADHLLIDGWTRNPKATDVTERLEKEGYRLFDGRWISEQEFANRPEGKLERAIRSGLVEPSMTAAQVRRSRGKPDSVARSATAGQVTEIWTYRLADSSQILVRFVKRAGQPEMSVAEVMEGKGK